MIVYIVCVESTDARATIVVIGAVVMSVIGVMGKTRMIDMQIVIGPTY